MSADDYRINKMNMNLKESQIKYDEGLITYEQLERLKQDVKKKN